MTTTTTATRPSWGARANAAVYDPFLHLGELRGMRARRAELVAGARGRVLEVGAGTGLNLPHYPAGLASLLLTEPDPGMAARLRRRVRRSGRTAAVVEAGADLLPVADSSIDTVVSTMVLCTVPDPAAALREITRVLRPDGRLLFCEHVLSDDPRLARRQRRRADAWAGFAAGCRCDRSLLDEIAAVLLLDVLTTARWRGMPALVHPLVLGSARPHRAPAGDRSDG